MMQNFIMRSFTHGAPYGSAISASFKAMPLYFAAQSNTTLSVRLVDISHWVMGKILGDAPIIRTLRYFPWVASPYVVVDKLDVLFFQDGVLHQSLLQTEKTSLG